jgi:DUF4097 and DUF4098 domain-containing protein YvlB
MRLLVAWSTRARIGAVGLAALAASGCVDMVATGALSYVEQEEKQFTVQGRPDVRLSTFDGTIELRPWDRSEVLVVVEKHALSKEGAADIEVVAEQDGSRVTVDARVKPAARHFGFGVNRSARLIVSLPASSDVQATSGDGSIDVERLSGQIELRSGDGSIRGRELSGDIRAQTGDGSIRLREVTGSLNLGTGDGSIVADGTMSALRARSGDGSISIRVESRSMPNADWNITTGDGSVTLELPDQFDAELDAHTGDGRVSVHGDLSETIESSKRSVRGRLGKGGRALRLRTGDGSIMLRR